MDEKRRDRNGDALLESRIRSCTRIVEEYLQELAPPRIKRTFRSVVITGTGSSSAHAKYLAWLLNNNGIEAEYLPLSAFRKSSNLKTKGRGLIVISQGLSPNAELALAAQKRFKHAILLTSVGRTSAESKQKIALTFKRSGGTIINFPIADEYTLLIRVIGPLLGYLACLKTAGALGVKLPKIQAKTLITTLSRAENRAQKIFSALKPPDLKGSHPILCASPLSLFSENLTFKFVEGIYVKSPVICDFMHFAHGTFQELVKNPTPAFLLMGKSNAESKLKRSLEKMLKGAGVTLYTVQSKLPVELQILEFEMIFNFLILRLMRGLGVNQKSWPGKGRDEALYGIRSF